MATSLPSALKTPWLHFLETQWSHLTLPMTQIIIDPKSHQPHNGLTHCHQLLPQKRKRKTKKPYLRLGFPQRNSDLLNRKITEKLQPQQSNPHILFKSSPPFKNPKPTFEILFTERKKKMASLSLLSPPSLKSTSSLSLQTRLILRTPSSLTLRTPSSSFNSIKVFSSPSPTPLLTQDDLKKLAADKAVEYVKSGMVLGLGTGSTAAFVVSKIGELYNSGQLKDIVGIPTSKRTAEQAASLGIPLSILDDHPHLDLAIDGADEVDPDLNLVKGRGGALLREKMVEAASDRFVVVVDDTKLVDGLGGSGLAMPVEVVQFCWKYNLVRLQELFKGEGCEAKLRVDGDGKPYVTDNSNYIVDLYFKTPIKDGEAAGKEISGFEGVVEHGLFLDMATAVIIAGKEGVSIKTK